MTNYINGYFNPSRSNHLNDTLKTFQNEPKKRWEGQKPTFFQTVEKMHQVGKGLLVFSGIFAIIAFAVPMTSLTQFNEQLIVGGIFAGSALASGILGILALTKSYWKDSAYCQLVREEILDHLILNGYNKTTEKYGAINKQYHLVSEAEIDHVMGTHFHMDQKTYLELTQDVENSRYITSEMKNRAFLKEIEAKTVLEISRAYSLDHYPRDFITKNLHVIHKKLLNEIKDTPILGIINNYSFIFLKEIGDVIHQKLLQESTHMSWEQIFTTYNSDNKLWDLFELGIVQGPSFREKAEQELKQHGLIYMLQKYSSYIFKYLVLDRFTLNRADYREIFKQVTFIEYSKNYASGLSVPPQWHQKAAELVQEYRDATIDRLEPIPGKVGADGQGIYKMIKRQDPATLAQTLESINQRWNDFLIKTDI